MKSTKREVNNNNGNNNYWWQGIKKYDNVIDMIILLNDKERILLDKKCLEKEK